LVAEFAPTMIVAYSNDHLKSFSLRNMPALCIGVGEYHDAPSAEAATYLRIPARRVAGVPDIAEALLRHLLASSFDPAFSEELAFFDDLGVPLFHLFEGLDRTPPLLPILINCAAAPRPLMQRCYDFGLAVDAFLHERYPSERVLILGTGGLSHWVGTPRTGEVNSEFDRRVLELLLHGNIGEMLTWNDDDVEERAGNGALEIKNWLAALGTLGAYCAEELAYAAVPEWLIGASIVAAFPAKAGRISERTCLQ
jgi:hypothetical protein